MMDMDIHQFHEEILRQINEEYAARRHRRGHDYDVEIQSDGLSCVIEAMCGALYGLVETVQEMGELFQTAKERIQDLENIIRDGDAFDDLSTRIDDLEGLQYDPPEPPSDDVGVE